jgi:hypothetical protein
MGGLGVVSVAVDRTALSAAKLDRWAAHFFSEGNAARAQMEQIKQEKDTKQIIR